MQWKLPLLPESLLPPFWESFESSQKYYSSSRQGSLLPSCMTSPGTNQSSEQERSDLQMYQRWKRKIPFQPPEGTWLQISQLLRKTEHSGGPRGCIPAGILASPPVLSWKRGAGSNARLQSTKRTQAGTLCFLSVLQHRWQCDTTHHTQPCCSSSHDQVENPQPFHVLCLFCTPCSQHSVRQL